jgi:HD domain
MNIMEIYKKYQIMPNLAEHQLKVAAVGEMICEHWRRGTTLNLTRNDAETIIAACLLHDMGNILKFDLTKTKSLLNMDIDLEFWQKVKEEYLQKYGEDEHQAALKIAQEIGATPRIIELIDCIGFNTGQMNAEAKDFGKKICAYSDIRVGPRGVISLEERLADLRVRYDNKFHMMGGNEEKRSEFENGLREIERQIFEHCNIKPSDITEEAIADRKERLKSFKI